MLDPIDEAVKCLAVEMGRRSRITRAENKLLQVHMMVGQQLQWWSIVSKSFAAFQHIPIKYIGWSGSSLMEVVDILLQGQSLLRKMVVRRGILLRIRYGCDCEQQMSEPS